MKHRRTVALMVAAAALVGALGAGAEDMVGPFRWARKLYDPTVPVEEQLTKISRNYDTDEAAALAGSDNLNGLVDLRQWSGASLQVGVRNFAGNTLAGADTKNYWVSLADWNIEEGAPTVVDGQTVYVFVPKWQQDAHLRFGFVAAAAADLPMVHGSTGILNGTLPYNAIVVELAFRIISGGAPGWQLGDYNGVPTQCGVWQVPAGMTLAQAQASDANRLAAPTFLSDTTPDTVQSFLLEPGADGSWTLSIDRDCDGIVDRVVTSADAGNLPSSFVVGTASGLLVGTTPAGGTREPNVGRSPMTMAYSDTNQEPGPPPLPTSLAVNAAGAEYTASDSVVYAADSGFEAAGSGTIAQAITGTVDPVLYKTYRNGKLFYYSAALANGTYQVTLKFVEPTNRAIGKRVFDVNIEGVKVIDNLDLYKVAGLRKAYDVTVDVTVADQRIDMSFAGENKTSAVVSAIRVVPAP